jgi:hypothetical protein
VVTAASWMPLRHDLTSGAGRAGGRTATRTPGSWKITCRLSSSRRLRSSSGRGCWARPAAMAPARTQRSSQPRPRMRVAAALAVQGRLQRRSPEACKACATFGMTAWRFAAGVLQHSMRCRAPGCTRSMPCAAGPTAEEAAIALAVPINCLQWLATRRQARGQCGPERTCKSTCTPTLNAYGVR